MMDLKCCINCFNNDFIKAVIKEQNEIGVCSYCDMDEQESADVTDIDVIGEIIRTGLSRAYENATRSDLPYYYYESLNLTKSIADVLIDEKEVFSEVLINTADVLDFIQDLFKSSGPSDRDIMQGGVDEWEEGDAKIIKIDEIYSNEGTQILYSNWNEFKYIVKHVNRFFDVGGLREEMLYTLTEYFQQMELILPNDTHIWRARLNINPLFDQLDDMKYELGPPPRDLAISLRMNPAGISYFYGSFDKNTCKKEVRHQSNDNIVYGHFATKKELQIVNLSVAIYSKSIFDPEYDHFMNWASTFLEGFVKDISKPINEESAFIEYIPTQILSEYIRKLGYDGLCFKSCFTGELNYTLFCGREEVSKSKDYHTEFTQINQIPEFTEWFELVDYKSR